MKVKKAISIALLSCLFINTSTPSFAGVLSEDRRYETFRDSNIAVNDILEEDKVDVKIEGNTLVNLADIESEFKIRDSNAYYKNFTICEVSKLKINTDYTLFIYKELLDNHNQNYNIFEIGVGNQLKDMNTHPEMTTNNGVGYNYYFDETKTKEIVKIKVNFKNFKECKYLSVRPIRRYSAPVSTQYCNANVKIVLLEGDYTDKNIEYFEGLQSSFENQLVTQGMIDSGQEKAENLGKYKVEYKVTGKNKFDGKLEIGGINNSTGVNTQYDNNGIRTIDYIEVKGNAEYVLSNDKGYYYNVYYYDSNYNFISLVENSTIITPSNCKYIRFRTWQQRVETDLTVNFQLEEGSTATEYEPYKESIKTFYLNSPLLEGDVLEVINGQATHVHKYRQALLDGSDDESWQKNSVENEDLNLYSFYMMVQNKKTYGDMINDKVVKLEKSEWDNCSVLGLFNGIRAFGMVSNLSTITELNDWLKENPITVVYELDEPTYEPIKADLSVQLFEGTTHISNNSNIPANMEISVDRVLNRAVEAIELAKTSPTMENLALARMWTNLVKDSIKKDELQNEINNITEIEDLKIEKESISANMDVYIRSENALSMSLSTNHVTFDGYNGTEDLEKLNAVDIVVSSSLPYDLNAYLEETLHNTDKSSIMSPTVVNIKEGSSSNYNQFINNSDKVVLKNDCEATNNKNHSIDLKLASDDTHKADVYKAVIKFEAVQK